MKEKTGLSVYNQYNQRTLLLRCGLFEWLTTTKTMFCRILSQVITRRINRYHPLLHRRGAHMLNRSSLVLHYRTRKGAGRIRQLPDNHSPTVHPSILCQGRNPHLLYLSLNRRPTTDCYCGGSSLLPVHVHWLSIFNVPIRVETYPWQFLWRDKVRNARSERRVSAIRSKEAADESRLVMEVLYKRVLSL